MRALIKPHKLLVKYQSDVRIVAVAFCFYMSAYLGYFLTFQNTNALPTWPPSGIAFALLILLGRNVWPGIMIGSLLANLMAFWNNAALPPHAVIALSALIAVANTGEALVGNFLIRQWVGNDYPFSNTRDAFRFLFVTLFMALTGTSLATISLLANDVVTEGQLMSTLLSGWVRSVVGILLFTPFILSIHHFLIHFSFTSDKIFQLGVLLIFALGLAGLVQVDVTNPTLERALPFLILPLLLWLAFRFDLMIAIAGVVTISLLSIYITIQGKGPFVLEQPSYSMLLLQIFIGVMSISTLVLSATVKERMEAQRKLLTFNETLEANVLERTRALNEEINTRKEAEEKIKRTNLELSKRNSELDNFVYSVSHDLRAPIASVLGLINLARKDKDAAMKDVYLDRINQSALQQDHFIREILDQSRNSRLDIKREEIFFQPIIDETFDQLKFATSTGKSVQKVVQVKQDKPFYSDRWRLKVILNNIISNSIRYRNGKDPVIRVNVSVENNSAQVEIEDNGKGIAREHINNVCNMFYRATDDGAGSGLGLYIVKETVDRLNGTLRIYSEVGKGTMVRLSIPEVV